MFNMFSWLIINLASTSVNTTGYWVYDKLVAAGQTLHPSSGDDYSDREEKNFTNYLEKLSFKFIRFYLFS